jgi:hypothetical protein
VYTLYRDRIADEDLLVYHRLSWLLVAQPTAFGVWAIAFSRAGGPVRAGNKAGVAAVNEVMEPMTILAPALHGRHGRHGRSRGPRI